MILMRQWPDEPTRTPGNSCEWVCETVIGGQTFTARSRNGAPQELARVLMAAGVSDTPVRVEQAGLPGYATCRSLHAMAKWTYEESSSAPLRRIPYARVEAARERARMMGVEAPKQGVNASGGTEAGVNASPP